MRHDGGGTSPRAQAAVLQALGNLGKATSNEIAVAIGRAPGTVRRSLSALYHHRNKYIDRHRDQRTGRGRAYIYWVSPSAPPFLVPTLPKHSKARTQATVFQAVVDAEQAVGSLDVAVATRLTRAAVQCHLRALFDQRVLSRSKLEGHRDYVYLPIEGATPKELGVEDLDWLWWAPIRQATEQARSSWREGERPLATPTTALFPGFDQRRQARMGD